MRRSIYLEGERVDPYIIGENQISKKFKNIFEILLTSNYYEGSNYGYYYNTFKANGSNSI